MALERKSSLLGGDDERAYSPPPCDRAGSPDFSPRAEKRSSAGQWSLAEANAQAARSRTDAGDGGHRYAPAPCHTNVEIRRIAPSQRTRKNAPSPGEKRPSQGDASTSKPQPGAGAREGQKGTLEPKTAVTGSNATPRLCRAPWPRPPPDPSPS